VGGCGATEDSCGAGLRSKSEEVCYDRRGLNTPIIIIIIIINVIIIVVCVITYVQSMYNYIPEKNMFVVFILLQLFCNYSV